MVFIGTSGWQYRHWRRLLYPRGLPTEAWLAEYVRRFGTVEVNNTFYRLPERSTFERWRAATPDGFVFAVKASRYLTHVRRLIDPSGPVELLLDRASALGDRLGPVLLQLPPGLEKDVGRLDATLAAFPRGVRVAVEFRHASWFDAEIRAVLERREAALCLADRGERAVSPAWRTAAWSYLRFHGGRSRPGSCYRPAALQRSADLLCATWPDSEDVYAYFNNDHAGCALRDASRFARCLDERGRPRTRTEFPTDL